MTIKDKVILYIHNRFIKLEQEKENLNNMIWHRPLDSLDHYEIMRSKIAVAVAEEILNDLCNIVLFSNHRREDK